MAEEKKKRIRKPAAQVREETAFDDFKKKLAGIASDATLMAIANPRMGMFATRFISACTEMASAIDRRNDPVPTTPIFRGISQWPTTTAQAVQTAQEALYRGTHPEVHDDSNRNL
jgi:hypothetical protein